MKKIDYSQVHHVKEIHGVSAHSLSMSQLNITEPVIFRGLVDEWPTVNVGQQSSAQAQQYLQTFYNNKPVQSLVTPAEVKGRYFYNNDLSGFNFTRENMLLTDVFKKINQSSNEIAHNSYYVGSTSINHILPGFRAQNDIPVLKNTPLVSIWLGNQSRIAAHYDIPDNLACITAGKRRFTLFPPEQLANLYVGPLDFTPAGQSASLVDFHDIDFKQYPKFQQALNNAQVAELSAGDALFIPSMWWHHVEALSDFNILVNYWWRKVDHFMGAPIDAMNHALLSIRDLPPEQREAWRNMFEHYVFSPNEQAHIPESKQGILKPIDETLARQLRALLINKLNR
jgi:hypothetical protein